MSSDHDYCYFSKVNCLSLNVCGLKAKLLSKDFENFIKDYDVIALTETKLDQLDDLSNYFDGYNFMHKNRKFAKHASGGVALLVKRSIYKYFKSVHSENDWSLWFHIDKELFGQEILIGVVYIPPESSRYSSVEMFEEIESHVIASSKENTSVCILGDFNARCGNLCEVLSFDQNVIDLENEFIMKQIMHEQMLLELGHNLNRLSSDKICNNYGYRLIDMCKYLGLLIANGRCGKDGINSRTTCSDVSTIDLVICTPDILCKIVEFEIMPFCNLLSDKHNPIHMSFKKHFAW